MPSRKPSEVRTFPGFAGFRDDPDAPFYLSRMPGFSRAEATATEIVSCFSRVVFAVWALRPDAESRTLGPFVELLVQRITMAAEAP